MKFLIQVVNHASVDILDTQTKTTIGRWLLIYVGISKSDVLQYLDKIDRFIAKIATSKFFHNSETHKIDQSLVDINGEILLISNFTLYGDNKKGTKLDFSDSAGYEDAKKIYDELILKLKGQWIRVQTGEFGAMMLVDSQNDGPINLIFDY